MLSLAGQKKDEEHRQQEMVGRMEMGNKKAC
jgi:hypothetical protein